MAGLLGKAAMQDEKPEVAGDAPEKGEMEGPSHEKAESPEVEAREGMMGDMDETPSNVSPEEQEAYDTFVSNGLQLMSKGGKINDAILQRLEATGDPIDDLANATVMIVVTLVESAANSNAPVPDEVVMHGGVEILEHLVELAEKAGIHDYTEKEMEGALYRALDYYREWGKQSGRVDEEALKGEFEQIVEADRSGRLDAVLPGLPKGDDQSAADEEA